MSRKMLLLASGLTLGLGWALRGHFGHQWGASWAGMLLCLAIVAMADRPDWSARLPVLAALGTLGWSVGGTMSYGLIVGYGRGDGFANVYYGLAMLSVVGFIWGAVGGGFFGLGLETTRDKKPDWFSLLARMVASAWIFDIALVRVLELKMTPPRHEAWAGCLGAAVALIHYLYRKGYHRALRVSLYTALGSGLGFALGNFFQTVGGSTGINFNWWNVMEFTLGFCGGVGAAWAVFSTEWPESHSGSRAGNWLALLFIMPGIPLVNLMMTFKVEKFIEVAEKAGWADPAGYARLQPVLGAAVTVAMALSGIVIWRLFSDNQRIRPGSLAFVFLCLQMFGYILFSHLRKSFFWGFGGLQLEQYLYWPIALAVVAIWFLFLRGRENLFGRSSLEPLDHWLKLYGWILVAAALLALVSVNLHDGLSGARFRF